MRSSPQHRPCSTARVVQTAQRLLGRATSGDRHPARPGAHRRRSVIPCRLRAGCGGAPRSGHSAREVADPPRSSVSILPPTKSERRMPSGAWPRTDHAGPASSPGRPHQGHGATRIVRTVMASAADRAAMARCVSSVPPVARHARPGRPVLAARQRGFGIVPGDGVESFRFQEGDGIWAGSGQREWACRLRPGRPAPRRGRPGP